MSEQPNGTSDADRGQLRTLRAERLVKAFSLMTLSKVLSVAVQLIALPVALEKLGVERYGAFLTFQAFVSWLGLVGLGLGPTLPRFIAASVARNDNREQRDIVMSTVVFMVSVGLFVAICLISLAAIVPVRSLISASPLIPGVELSAGYFAVVVLSCGQLVITISSALRSGFQELHWTAIWTCVGNVVTLVLLLYAPRYHLTISILAIVLYGPVVVLLWIDVVLLFLQHSSLFSFHFNFRRFFHLLSAHSVNALVMQLSVFVVTYLPIVLVAHIAGPVATAAYAIVMQPLMLMLSGLNLITSPLVPAIASAHSRGDLAWIRTAYGRAFKIVLGASIFVAVTLAAFGPTLFSYWLHKDVGIGRPLCIFMGLYFGCFALSVFHFNILAAMGNIGNTARLYLIESFFAEGLGLVLLYLVGPAGMAAGLAIGIGSVTAWYFPYKVRTMLKSDFDHGAVEPFLPLGPVG